MVQPVEYGPPDNRMRALGIVRATNYIDIF